MTRKAQEVMKGLITMKFIVAISLMGMWALGCGGSSGRENEADGGADAAGQDGAAADSGADGDSDGDGDGDADTDADTDTDVDTDADTDSDGDGDVDTDGDSDTDADADAGADTGADTGTDSGADADADADTDADGDADAGGDSAADAEADAGVDAHVDSGFDAGPEVYMFAADGVSTAIGGRSGADTMCTSARTANYSSLPDAHVRAFISVSASDEIRDMPSNYSTPTDREIRGPTHIKLADDWADLLDGTVDVTLFAAGILDDSFWYSGSDGYGALSEHNCSGWTSPDALFDGAYGLNSNTDSQWMNSGSEATCGLNSYHVLCLAWE